MIRSNRTSQRNITWNSRRYFTLIHSTLLFSAASTLVFAAPKSAKIVALDKATGKTITSAWLWRSQAAGGAGVISGDVVLFIEDGKLLKSLNTRTGKLQWQVELATVIPNPPVVGTQKVLVYKRDEIWAYSLMEGRLIWRTQLPPAEPGWSLSADEPPVVAETVLSEGGIYLCNHRRVLALSGKSGSPLWLYSEASLCEKQTPVLEDEYLYLRTTNPGQPWQCLSTTDGLVITPDGHVNTVGGFAPARVETTGLEEETRKTLSPDRRTLTVSTGGRVWKFQAPASFSIAGIIGETPNAVCIQIVSTDRPAPVRTPTKR
jgi:outer membrane protein assembly factor BamB